MLKNVYNIPSDEMREINSSRTRYTPIESAEQSCVVFNFSGPFSVYSHMKSDLPSLTATKEVGNTSNISALLDIYLGQEPRLAIMCDTIC